MNRVVRENAKAIVGVLAVLGFGAGVTLDATTTWAAAMPLTANLVAGLLGGPLPILLALLFFDRLIAAERSRGWLLRNWEALQDVVPVLLAADGELTRTWPLDEEEVEARVTSLADLLEPLAGHLQPGAHALPEPVQHRLVDVARLPSIDLDALPERIRALVTDVEILAGQSDLPQLSEAAINVKTAAGTLQAGIAGYGMRAEYFIKRVHDLATCPWTWDGDWFQLEHDFGNRSTSHPNYIARDGFQYARLLGEARVLRDACRSMDHLISHTLA